MISALDFARRVERGELSPRAVVEQCAAAIAAREADFGSFTVLDLDGALRHAETDGARLASLPLRGLPVGFKDIFDTADLPTEYGSPIYAGHRPKADAVLVSLTRRAGGVVIGKTVTTEFASLQPAGTRNPHHPGHTPGGSSSGSAAAVAAGMLPLAVGSQTGGSVIRPAAFCGVAGFKPSYRLLPTLGMKCNAWHLDTAGLFAASVADVAFAATAITGRDLRVDRAAPAAPRIALVRGSIWPQASAAMQQAVEAAAKAAAKAGATISEPMLPPIFDEALQAHGVIQDYETFQALAWEWDHHRDAIGPLVRARLEHGSGISPADYDAARRTARRARQAFADLMAEADILLAPSAPGAAPSGLESTGDPVFNRLWTLLGCPCINVPGLADAAGLPLGVQAIGRFGRDRRALEGALFLENAVARMARA